MERVERDPRATGRDWRGALGGRLPFPRSHALSSRPGRDPLVSAGSGRRSATDRLQHRTQHRDRTIVAVGNAGEIVIPEGATHIDAHGRYLMAGLADMHTHVQRPDDLLATGPI